MWIFPMRCPSHCKAKKKILLIDNAQKVTKEMSYYGIKEKTIVAAFSPGAKVDARFWARCGWGGWCRGTAPPACGRSPSPRARQRALPWKTG